MTGDAVDEEAAVVSQRGPGHDPASPLWVTWPELRSLAELLAQDRMWTRPSLEDPDLIAVVVPRAHVEAQLRAVLTAGWRPPVIQAGTLAELEALPPGTVVTDADGQVWVRKRVGEWCEPYLAGIDPDELLADGPVTVHHTPGQTAVTVQC